MQCMPSIYVLQQFIAILEPLTIHIPQVDKGCRIAKAGGYRIIRGKAASLKEVALPPQASSKNVGFHKCTQDGKDEERHTPGTTANLQCTVSGGGAK